MNKNLLKKIFLILGFIGLACSFYPIWLLLYYGGRYLFERDNPYRYEYMLGIFYGIYWGFPIFLVSSFFALFGVKSIKSKTFAIFYIPTILTAIPFVYFFIWDWIIYCLYMLGLY
jgi:hypothetical protein